MNRHFHAVGFVLALAISLPTPAAAEVTDAPVTPIRAEREGLPNFAQVSTNLYRGAQPDAKGYASLAALGVRTIVNLRSAHDDDLPPGSTLCAVRIPMKADKPDVADVRTFLRIVATPTNLPVYVHCRRGADRTGLMVAAYRIVIEGWDKAKAIEEMKHGGYKFYAGYEDIVTTLKDLDVPVLRAELQLPRNGP